ncbi:MAG TPA: FAD-dependent oxidoreductase [Acidimicrobiales bacterium]|nr:FAD-dependent oxidoreductase [Acidimicrobiales bacterium]
MQSTDVVIIGAGPNGMAIAAHLEHAGVERRVFGSPFSTWKSHMPKGMFLKSEPYGSDVASPVAGHRVRDYCQLSGTEYANRHFPISLETFVGYADRFQRDLVPDVEDVKVTRVDATEAGRWRLRVGDVRLEARRVVVATGVIPFAYTPKVLAPLPHGLVTHSSAHSDLSAFRGQRVAVIGRGQSALEAAALLHELGADAEVIARGPTWWHEAVPERPSAWRLLRHPVNPLCESWACWTYQYMPDAFHYLPVSTRIEKARTVLGPAGSWWLRPRIEGVVPLRTGLEVVEARPEGDRVRLVLSGEGARPGGDVYDHVIAGTGFRFNIDRLDFLVPAVRAGLRLEGGAPRLSRAFESSMPGLHFVGAPATPSLGPSMRFIAGTGFTARRLVHHFSGGRRRTARGPTGEVSFTSSIAPSSAARTPGSRAAARDETALV